MQLFRKEVYEVQRAINGFRYASRVDHKMKINVLPGTVFPELEITIDMIVEHKIKICPGCGYEYFSSGRPSSFNEAICDHLKRSACSPFAKRTFLELMEAIQSNIVSDEINVGSHTGQFRFMTKKQIFEQLDEMEKDNKIKKNEKLLMFAMHKRQSDILTFSQLTTDSDIIMGLRKFFKYMDDSKALDTFELENIKDSILEPINDALNLITLNLITDDLIIEQSRSNNHDEDSDEDSDVDSDEEETEESDNESVEE